MYSKKDLGPTPVGLSVTDLRSSKTLRKVDFGNVKNGNLGIDKANNCCLLKDSSIVIIFNIFEHENNIVLYVKKFKRINLFEDRIEIKSSVFGVHKCSELSSYFLVPLIEVKQKCFRMPCWINNNPDESSDDSDEELSFANNAVNVINNSEEFIVCMLL